MTVVRIKMLRPGARAPKYSHHGDAGADLYLPGDQRVVVARGRIETVYLGFAIELPLGFKADVRPRSSQSRAGIHVSLGTVDAPYRGEVAINITALTDEGAVYYPGDRIGQLVVTPVEHVTFVESEELSETSRGQGGFGSTGR